MVERNEFRGNSGCSYHDWKFKEKKNGKNKTEGSFRCIQNSPF